MGKHKQVPPPIAFIPNKKGPKTLESISEKKSPVTVEKVTLYGESKLAWRIGKIQLINPYGWHVLSVADIEQIKHKLGHLERNTWKDVFVRDARNNHPISAAQLKCPIARDWMAKHMPSEPTLWTIRVSAKERIWGIISEGAYQIIFWDPEHLIWPVSKN